MASSTCYVERWKWLICLHEMRVVTRGPVRRIPPFLKVLSFCCFVKLLGSCVSLNSAEGKKALFSCSWFVGLFNFVRLIHPTATFMSTRIMRHTEQTISKWVNLIEWLWGAYSPHYSHTNVFTVLTYKCIHSTTWHSVGAKESQICF